MKRKAVKTRAVPLALLLAAGASGCDGGASGATERPVGEVDVVRVFPRLHFNQPVGAVKLPDSNLWWVFEKEGRIRRFSGSDPTSSALVADLSGRVESGPSEAGLLGIAIHPRFRANGRVYLSYTRAGAPLTSVIARFQSNDGGLTLDPASEAEVLTIEQPFANHNGGHLVFGPDGYLYAGFGDGGSGGDPHGNAQNTRTLLGKILRLDVDGAEPYAIPDDNPFADGGGRGEIWAYGLRNPWRFQFDRRGGDLWAADVGQNQWEEIDRITRGGNYGWNTREGAHCYGRVICDSRGLIDPVAEYDHAHGCSVTGGFVYRGAALGGLTDNYIYGDFCSGTLWALAREGETYRARVIVRSDLNIASFAEDAAGELLIVDMRGGIYALHHASPLPPGR